MNIGKLQRHAATRLLKELLEGRKNDVDAPSIKVATSVQDGSDTVVNPLTKLSNEERLRRSRKK